MKSRQNPSGKNRRDIGSVVTLIEKMAAARELSSNCVGVEALLESRDKIESHVKRRRTKTDG